ncbi:MAG: hypothetical protein AAB972_04565 [Patescibacteria group bacterium]
MDITYVVDKDTRYSQDDISAIVELGKILGYRSPKEVFFKERFFTIKFHGACGRCLRMERIWALFLGMISRSVSFIPSNPCRISAQFA